MTPLRPALLLTLGVWCVLLAAQPLSAWLGPQWGLLLCFALAAGMVWATRSLPDCARRRTLPGARELFAPLLGLAAGFALLPAQQLATSHLGLALGLEPSPTGLPPGWTGPMGWVAFVMLAPAFEEPLYRERLFLPLRARLGAPLAITATSALFAAAHVTSWQVLGTFLGGLLLGALMQLTGSLPLCIAVHAGLNLAAQVAGTTVLPPTLGILQSSVLGIAALAVSVWMLRSRGARKDSIPSPGTGALPAAASLTGVLVVAGLVLSAVPFLPRGSLVSLLARPRLPFEEAAAPPSPDYREPESWAALPGRKDWADVAPGAAGAVPQGNARADAFFVHPTTYLGSERWNQRFDDEETSRFVDGLVLANQASVFNACCRVYAPRYRQASLSAFLSDGRDEKQARDLAYGDVRRAFEHFLEAVGAERPILLAGHSQGSYHVFRLLRDFFAAAPLRERLVAAYLIGMPLPEAELSRSSPGLALCESAQQTGCVVTWNTVGPRANPVRSRIEEPIACVNPLTWTTDGRHAPSAMNLGGVVFAEEIDPRGLPRPGVADARCLDGLLVVSEIGEASFRPGLSLGQNYHILDYSLFYMNLRLNAQQRVASYLAAERRRRSARTRSPAPASAAATQAN